MRYLNDYYQSFDEEARLLDKHGQVEYLTTMKYIHEFLKPGARILEIGAGTGRYSLELAREGYSVDAVELVQKNIDVFLSKLLPSDEISIYQGNALDLSRYSSESFDITLSLGPMYHLYTNEDRIKALQEAHRVTKKGGHIFVAYCMNDATVIEHCFRRNKIHDCLAKHMLTEDFHCISKPKDVFALFRVEDIINLNQHISAESIVLLATDGATNYMRATVDAMDDETFALYMKYHYTVCERQDLIGATHHSLNILRKT